MQSTNPLAYVKETFQSEPPRFITRISVLLVLVFVSVVSPCSLQAEPERDTAMLVDTLLEQYRQIGSVSCDIRRDVTTPEGNIRWLSRVYFRQGNYLHAANAAPLPRLIIADGQTMHQHTSGAERGFRQNVADLDHNMRINLERIPGTLMDHLLRLQDAPETILEPTDAFSIRRAYEAEHVYAILEADDQLRLHRIQFYDATDRSRKTAEISCDHFEEVLPGVWIPMQHRAAFHVGENVVSERTRITNYHANVSIADNKFDPAEHFADAIEWVSSFEKL